MSIASRSSRALLAAEARRERAGPDGAGRRAPRGPRVGKAASRRIVPARRTRGGSGGAKAQRGTPGVLGAFSPLFVSPKPPASAPSASTAMEGQHGAMRASIITNQVCAPPPNIFANKKIPGSSISALKGGAKAHWHGQLPGALSLGQEGGRACEPAAPWLAPSAWR